MSSRKISLALLLASAFSASGVISVRSEAVTGDEHPVDLGEGLFWMPDQALPVCSPSIFAPGSTATEPAVVFIDDVEKIPVATQGRGNEHIDIRKGDVNFRFTSALVSGGCPLRVAQIAAIVAAASAEGHRTLFIDVSDKAHLLIDGNPVVLDIPVDYNVTDKESALVAAVQSGEAVLEGISAQAKVETEQDVVHALGAEYFRAHSFPDDAEIEYLIRLMSDPELRIHFHDDNTGELDATFYMCMYEIFHSDPSVTLDEIIERQIELGGDKINKPPEKPTKGVMTAAKKEKRARRAKYMQLLRGLYDYSRDPDGYDANISWSEWMAENPDVFTAQVRHAAAADETQKRAHLTQNEFLWQAWANQHDIDPNCTLEDLARLYMLEATRGDDLDPDVVTMIVDQFNCRVTRAFDTSSLPDLKTLDRERTMLPELAAEAADPQCSTELLDLARLVETARGDQQLSTELSLLMRHAMSNFINDRQLDANVAEASFYKAFMASHSRNLVLARSHVRNITMVDFSRFAGNTASSRGSILGKPRADQTYVMPELLLFMKPSHFKSDREGGARYFSAAEKKEHKVRKRFGEDMLARDMDRARGHSHMPDGSYLYVVTPSGGLVGASLTASDDTKHSGPRAGQPVICAGEMILDRGRIIEMNPKSGHMLTPDENLVYTAVWMHANKVVDRQCNIRVMNKLYGEETEVLTIEEILGDLSTGRFLPAIVRSNIRTILADNHYALEAPSV